MRRLLLTSLALCLAIAALAGTAEAAPRIGIGNAVAVSPKVAGPTGAATGHASSSDATTSVSPKPKVIDPVTAGPSAPEASGPALFEDAFDRPDGLITNDFAHWSPNNAQSVKSADWEMTSGSLFARNGEAFTGVPDGCEDASPTSSPCTASAVFRLNSVRHDFGDIALSLNVVNDRLVATSRTPAVDFDGIHLWLRYQSEYELYAVSFNRRDGHIVIKKKCAGGSENGGTYYELGEGELAGYPIPFGTVQHVTATARNLPSGAVELTLARDGSTLLSVVDEGIGCAPITAPGAIGVRGDNDEFSFDDLTVTAL